MASLTEVRAEIKQASEQLSALLNDAKADGSTIANMTAAINELGAKRDALEAVERESKAADAESERKAFEQARGVAPAESKPEVKSFESLLGDAVRKMAANPKSEVEIGFDAKAFLEGKTVMSTGAGWAPESMRAPGSTEYARERRYVTDVIPVVPTNQAAYLFMEQTTRTNAAAETDESVQGTLASAPESAFAYTERTETLRKITHFVPVTREQVEDVPGLLAELQAEMREGVLGRLSAQIIAGSGTAPDIEGFLDAGRTEVNTQAKGADDILTAIRKGIKVNESTGFAAVDTILLNPTDWTNILTLKTADGVFIFGNPAQAAAPRLWGYPVVESTHVTAGTALLGGFNRYARLPVRGSVTVEMSNEHASFFIQDVWAIKASLRATLAVLRESAFTKVTGLS